MALNIRNPETERLAEALANLTGEAKTQVVEQAPQERLESVQRRNVSAYLVDELNEIATHYASLPILDERNEDEILG